MNNISPEATITIGTNGNIIACNQSFCDITGYTRDEIIDKKFTKFAVVKLKEIPEYINFFKSMTQGNNPGSLRFVWRHKDGTQRPTEAQLLIIKDGEYTTGIQALLKETTVENSLEQEINNNEEFKNAVLSATPDSIGIFDRNNILLDANESMAERIGKPLEELLGIDGLGFLPLKLAESRRAYFSKVFQTGQPVHFEDEHNGYHYDNTVFPISRNVEGEITRVAVIARDITEKKRAEEALKESEEKYFQLIDNSASSISVMQDGKIVFANKQMVKTTGYTIQQILSMNPADLVHPDDYEEIQNYSFERAHGKDVSSTYTFRFIHRNGSVRWLTRSSINIEWNHRPAVLFIDTDITDLKTTEEALKKSEEKFTKAFHSSSSVLGLTTLKEGKIIDVNEAFCRLTGYKRNELVGHTTTEFNIWANSSQRKTVIKRVQKFGRIKDYEVELRSKKSEIHHLLFSADKIILKGEACLLSTAVDITKRKLAEEALRESEEKHRHLFQASNNAIFLMDTDTNRILDLNKAAIESYGYSREEALKLKNVDFSAEPDKTYESIEKHAEYIPVRYHKKKDGTTFPTEISLVYMKQSGRNVCFATVCDITERMNAEEALRKSEEKFQKAFRSTPDRVAITTVHDGRFIDVNDSYIRHTGYTREEVIGHTTSELNSWPNPEDRKRITNILMKKGRVENEEVRLRIKSGEIRTSLFSAELIEIDGNECVLSVATDITERKKAEEALRASETQFRRLYENSPFGILTCELVTDENGEALDAVFLQGNLAVEAQTGRKLKDIEGKHMSEISPPDEFRKFIRIYDDVVKTKNPVTFTKYYALFDCTLETTAFPLIDNLFILSSINVTEQQEAQKALLESEDKFSKTFHLSSNLKAISKRKGGTYIEINDAFTRMLGYTREEVLGHNASDLNIWVYDEERDRLIKLLREQDNITNEEIHFRTKSGKILIGLYSSDVINISGEECNIHTIIDITRRKEVITELKESEEFNKSLLGDAPDSILVINPDTSVKYINPKFEEINGWTLEELRGIKAPYPWWPEEFKERFNEEFLEAMRQGSGHGESIVQKKNGERYWLEMHWSSVTDENGDMKYMMIHASDITERKEAEEALLASEDKFRRMFENANDAIVLVDLQGKFINANDNTCQILGLGSNEAIVGKDFAEFITPAESEKSVTDMGTLLGKGFVSGLEYLAHRKDGSTVPVEANASLLKDSEGNPNSIIAVIRNVSERKKAEEALLESHNYLEMMTNSMGDIVLSVKMPERIIEWVNTSINITGYTPEECIGRNTDFLFANKTEVTKLGKKTEKLLAEGQDVLHSEALFRRKNGDVFPAEITATFHIEGDTITGITSIIRDISEHKRLQEEQQRAEKLESIGTLAGGIAHDFNNLLTGIMGNIGMAIRSVEQDEKNRAREYMKDAENASNRARDLTQQLLTFARGGAPVKTPVSVGKLIKESTTFSLRGSSIKPEFSIPRNLPFIEADEGQMSQVFTNLIINAQESMPEGGIIRITAKRTAVTKNSTLPLRAGKYVEITIEDQGIGIKKEYLNRIFEPYFTTKQKGSGLGLATAYSVIKSHNGYVSAESNIGTGSIFRIYLPASNKKRARPRKAKMEKPVKGAGKVLVMDDDEIITKMLEQMLDLAGYEAAISREGGEAIRKYSEARESGKPFDAVIMDLTIPGGMGGKEAVREILEIDPDAKVIVSSGYATDPIMSDYDKYGFCAVITKPYSVSQLEKVLHGILNDS